MARFQSIKNRFHSFYKTTESFIGKYHRFYLGLLSLIAILGYFTAFVFPFMALSSGNNLGHHLYNSFNQSHQLDWQQIAISSGLLIIGAWLTFRLIKFKPALVNGINMPREKIPQVYQLVEQVQQHFKRPRIQRIVITAKYELDIIKTPKWPVPVWSENTLVIGLPVMLCLNPKQFELMLARRIGQFSKQHNTLTNWLYQLRSVWRQYGLAYERQKYPDSKLLKWLYIAYAAVYETVSVFAARSDELNADKYVMELYHHDEVRDMITVDAVCRWYLNKRFWPAMEKMQAEKKQARLTPFQKLPSIMSKNLSQENLKPLLQQVVGLSPEWNDPVPSLHNRLHNIGHDAPQMQAYQKENAAQVYLGQSLNGAVNLMDKLWLKNTLANA